MPRSGDVARRKGVIYMAAIRVLALVTAALACHATVRAQNQGGGVNPQVPDYVYARRMERLNDLSPLTVLSRGYAIAYGGEGNVVRSVSDLSEGSSVSLTLVDGSATCTVDSLCKTQRVQIDLEEV